MHWRKVTLVGVGLLGGSLGLALKGRRLADHVQGFVRRQSSLAECNQLGVVDQATLDLGKAVEDADLIIFCTPIGQMRQLATEMKDHVKAGAVVTDVGSVKGPVVQDLEALFLETRAHFIGSHPMAGAEKTGPAAAQADLFVNAVTVVTPTGSSDAAALEKTEQLWNALGARVLRLTPELHDDLVSRSSHLPHVVAAELANYVLSPVHPKEQAVLCANGFRDTTRIAAGSPDMWRDIALANRKNLARVLGVFIEDLQEFQLALEQEDTKAIREFFEQAKQRRDAWNGNHTPKTPE